MTSSTVDYAAPVSTGSRRVEKVASPGARDNKRSTTDNHNTGCLGFGRARGSQLTFVRRHGTGHKTGGFSRGRSSASCPAWPCAGEPAAGRGCGQLRAENIPNRVSSDIDGNEDRHRST